MVIFIVDIGGIFLDESKSHLLVSARLDSPRSFPIALELMEAQAREAHIFRGSGGA